VLTKLQIFSLYQTHYRITHHPHDLESTQYFRCGGFQKLIGMRNVMTTCQKLICASQHCSMFCL